METSIDVRAYAYGVLERFKKGFQEMGYLPPTGLVLEPTGKIDAFELDLSSAEAEKLSMERLGQLARETEAIAVFTIKDAVYRVFPKEGEEPAKPTTDSTETHRFRPDGVPRSCICMEIKVEGQTPKIVMIPYRITEQGKFEFGERAEAPLDFAGPEPSDFESNNSAVDD
jgi:hypothetical protein